MSDLIHAQPGNHVKWTNTIKKIGDKRYEIHFTATISSGWRIHPQFPMSGMEPTTFIYVKNPLLLMIGLPREVGQLITRNIGRAIITYYENTVDFIQKIKLMSGTSANLKGKIEIALSSSTEHLPLSEIDFSIDIVV